MQSDSERISALERRIGELETQLAVVLDAIGIRKQAEREHPGDLLALVRSKQKIQAIARYRDLYGVGLAEAKAAVEKLELELGVHRD